MTFDIRFLEMDDFPGEDHREGSIQLGSYSELFLADLSTWAVGQYERQWGEAARHLLKAGSPACFVTDMHDPAVAEVVGCWVAYPVGKLAVFQETFLGTEAMRGIPSANFHSLVRPRQVRTAEGRPISEWSVPLADVAAFANSVGE